MNAGRRLGVLLLAGASMLPACSGRERVAPTQDAGLALAAPPPAPAPTPPRGPFAPKKLRCETLMPPSEVAVITGVAPAWQERAHQRDGVATLVCSRRAAKPEDALSFQVTCALRGKRPPEGYEALRQLHLGMPGAREAATARAVVVSSSHLATHPYRPCFMQLVYSAAPRSPGALERLAALLASRVP